MNETKELTKSAKQQSPEDMPKVPSAMSEEEPDNEKLSLNGEREVDFNLIDSIIDEMKSEFNKNLTEDEDGKLDEVEAHSENDIEKIEVTTEGKESEAKRNPIETKPRIVITLKNTEENENGVKKVKSKEQQEESWTLVKVEPNPGRESSPGKRALRSQKAPLEPSAGVKRSARRRSKDCPRESVLQSAIARKEKSFSHMTPSSRSSGRLNKSTGNLTTKGDLKTKPVKAKSNPAVKLEEHSSPIHMPMPMPMPIPNDPGNPKPETNEPILTPNINKVSANFTKTGKRRYKPYKGLRYSFNSNKTKPIRRTKRYRSTSESTNASLDKDLKQDSSSSINNKKENDISTLTTNLKNSINLNAVTIRKEMSSCSTSRSESPMTAESCPVGNLKRKQSNSDLIYNEDISKRNRNDYSALTQSNGNSANSLCHCQKAAQLHVSSPPRDLYCQGTDTLGDRLVGCCNPIEYFNEVQLLRASTRVPYLLLCQTHTERFNRHGCCPTCGIFCTEGKFVMCPSKHLYHRECQMTVKGIGSICPHCGIDSPQEDTVIRIKYGRMPIFLPQQKPPKPYSPAKMSCYSQKIENSIESNSEDSPFETLNADVNLPNGKTISSQGLPEELTGNTITSLVATNKSINSSARYTIKSLYMAAKTGNAEKVLSILATGLNPNQPYSVTGNYAIHVACIGGHLATVHALQQAGALLDVMDREQNSPLLCILDNPSNNAIVKYLIKAGVDVNFKTGDGMTALHVAAKAGNLIGCHYLLMKNDKKNYINEMDDGNWTALVWAAEHGHAHVVRYLLEKRADPLIRDLEDNQAMHWAALSGSVEICEKLIDYGCEVNCVNIHGDTPLHIGARQNMFECVMFLLMRGANTSLQNIKGDLASACCISGSDCEAAIILNTQLQSNRSSSGGIMILTNDITKGKESNPIQCINAEGDGELAPKDFVYIKENCFTSQLNGPNRLITSLKSCNCTESCNTNSCECANLSIKCWYDNTGKLIENFNYLDPPMFFECNPACSCSIVTCQNRVVQHGISCRFQLFRTRTRGWGVRTLLPIPKGTYVCEYIGEIITDSEAERREDDTYLFDLIIKDEEEDGTFCLDARYYGNIARFINHMCVPNLLPVHVFIDHQDVHFPRIAFFTNRDVDANEELGFDYGVKFWKIKGESFTCTCGHNNCRYSDITIKQTLENYKRKQQESMVQQLLLKSKGIEELTIPSPQL